MRRLTTAIPTLPLLIATLCVQPACVLDWDNQGTSIDDGSAVDAVVDSGGPIEVDATMDVGCKTPAHDASCDDGGWCKIPAGCFVMGSPDAEPCRNTNENQHRVTLKHRFEMQRYETSGPEFLDHFVIKLGGLNKYDSACTASEGHSCPMNNLTWIEALAHCDAINLTDSLDAETSCYDKEPNQYEKSCEDKDGVCPKDSELCICMKNSPGCKRVCVEYKVKEIYAENIHDCPGYRLPTEAEWEYAYRAGTVEALYSGEHPTPAQCDGCSTGDNAIVGDIAQHYCSPPIQNENQNHPGPSGRALPNRWGLYDLAGNAAEWTFDNYQDIAGSTWVIDPQGPPSGSRRTMRGGTLMENAREFRAASRYGISPSTRYKLHGFRCVKSNQNP